MRSTDPYLQIHKKRRIIKDSNHSAESSDKIHCHANPYELSRNDDKILDSHDSCFRKNLVKKADLRLLANDVSIKSS